MHETQTPQARSHVVGVRVTSRLVLGFVVIALGVVFTLDNLGFMDAGDALRWWPVAPLLFGLMRLTGIGSNRNLGAGLVITLVCGWLLLHNFDLVSFGLWDLFPLILIVLGTTMVFRSLDRSRRAALGESPESTMGAFALWSGLKRKVTAQDFRGGDVTAIMGGHEIDFRSAKMADGTAVLDLFVWWGGVDLQVPEDWMVTTEAMALMGAIDDKSKAPPAEPRGHLILKGLVVMGGVDIKN